MTNSGMLSEDQQGFLLATARQVITTRLQDQPFSSQAHEALSPVFSQKRGVFVTLKKKETLRGCIGYPLPVKGLLDAVIDNAAAAAFQDPRFPPLSLQELAEINIEISVLTVPMVIADPLDVVLGRDGILISSGFNRGLLLPQVPIEQGWDLKAYLDYGCIKAGLPADRWQSGTIQIEVFQAQVFGEN